MEKHYLNCTSNYLFNGLLNTYIDWYRKIQFSILIENKRSEGLYNLSSSPAFFTISSVLKSLLIYTPWIPPFSLLFFSVWCLHKWFSPPLQPTYIRIILDFRAGQNCYFNWYVGVVSLFFFFSFMFPIKPVNQTFFFKSIINHHLFHSWLFKFCELWKGHWWAFVHVQRNELVKCVPMTELTSLFLMNAPHLLEQKLNFHRLRALWGQASAVIDSQVDDYVIMNF